MNRRKSAFSFRFIYLFLLFGAWFTLLGSLIKSSYFEGSSFGNVISLKTGIKDIPSDSEWMTITHHGKKLGYSINSVANLGDQGYSVASTTQLNITVAGIETKLLMKNYVTVDTLFRLLSFDFQLQSDQFLTHLKGKKVDQTLLVTLIHRSDSTTREIQVPDEIYTYLSIQPMIAWKGFKEGGKITLPAFDPVSMEIGQVDISHEGKNELLLGNKTFRLNKIRVEFKGVPSILWLDDNGLTYREETIMGLVMEKTTPDEALLIQPDGSEIDLLDVYAIPVSTFVKDQTSLSELILEIDGIDPHYLEKFNSDRQSVIRENPLRLRLRPVPVPQIHVPLDTFLVSNSLIQCNNPRIEKLTRELTKNDPTKQDKVNRLNNWVYHYLEKRPVVTLTSALEILDRKQGDCSEHTTLFTSLSRNAEIPTKIHIGLVYLEGRFLYHAWPVVYLDENWIAVDPTLGQTVADATHITLLEGDFNNLTELIPLLGRVTIRIIKQKYEKRLL